MNRLLSTTATCLVMMAGLANAQTFDTAAGAAAKIGFAKAGAHTNIQPDCIITMPSSVSLIHRVDSSGDQHLHLDNDFRFQVDMKQIGRLEFNYNGVEMVQTCSGVERFREEPLYAYSFLDVEHQRNLNPNDPAWPRNKRWASNGDGRTWKHFTSLYTANSEFRVKAASSFQMHDSFVLDEHCDVSFEATLTCYTN